MQPVTAVQTRTRACGEYRRRWLHGSLTRQASIKIPASMTEGSNACWNTQEGDESVQRDILVQIQLDFDGFDNVDAQSPITSGKILLPDVSTKVPVEQFIALVTQDATRLGQIQNGQLGVSSPSPYVSVEAPISAKLIATVNSGFLSPNPLAWKLSSPHTPRTPRTPTTGGYGSSVKVAARPRPRLLRLEALSSRRDLVICPSPRYPSSAAIPSPFRIQLQEDVATTPLPSTPLTAKWPGSGILRSALVSREEMPRYIK